MATKPPPGGFFVSRRRAGPAEIVSAAAIMKNKVDYQSNDYDRQSQRFVIPLYIKDDLDNFEFSSTGTLAKYKGHHYILFAAHALAGNLDFDRVHIFGADGQFHQIKALSIGHHVFSDQDIVIVDCFNQVMDGKNYFNLDQHSLIGFEKKVFAWTGFPASLSNSKQVHRSNTPDKLKERFVSVTDHGSYFNNARYFTIHAKLKANNKIQIAGVYNRKNVNLKYKGNASTGPHPKGMSGGAMYFFAKDTILKSSLDETFRFAGIGIEYKDNTIIGVPRSKIVELLELFDKEMPLRLALASNHDPDNGAGQN
ncbi:hypothetical protein SB751_20315 [Cupriavidus sp. SIMBA_020]|uniref:hypothetical protein n=2 Tax=Bacteria TaxID=2 RepID=UPI00397A850B